MTAEQQAIYDFLYGLIEGDCDSYEGDYTINGQIYFLRVEIKYDFYEMSNITLKWLYRVVDADSDEGEEMETWQIEYELNTHKLEDYNYNMRINRD